MTEARQVTVRGRVQGVGFRAWTRDAAAGLDVSGWVMNRPDGTVEAHLEGSRQMLERMIARLHEGPPGARVEDVAVREVAARGLGPMEIRR